MSAESWMVIGAAAILGVLLLANLWRQATRRVSELESELGIQTDRTKRLASDLSKESQVRKRQSEELATVHKRADKLKRRKSKAIDQPLGTASRIRDHEAEAERFRVERDLAASERDVLATSIAELERQLAISRRALEKATAPAPVVAAVSDDSGVETALGEARDELAASQERAIKLEEELEIARLTEARMRKRMSIQEQLYASVRAELDVKKDRLRTQEEQLQRLQALKVAVID